ncbi:hypothetical protein B0H17DRAFT_1108761, partial [Mycena rosella]
MYVPAMHPFALAKSESASGIRVIFEVCGHRSIGGLSRVQDELTVESGSQCGKRLMHAFEPLLV